MHTQKPANSTFHCPIKKNLISVLCFLIEILSRVHAKGVCGGLMITSLTSIGRFPNDGAAMMAVKGLRAAAATL